MTDNKIDEALRLREMRDNWGKVANNMYNYGITGIHNPAKLHHVEYVVRALDKTEIKAINDILVARATIEYSKYVKTLEAL